jgi:hypothetical protein
MRGAPTFEESDWLNVSVIVTLIIVIIHHSVPVENGPIRIEYE